MRTLQLLRRQVLHLAWLRKQVPSQNAASYLLKMWPSPVRPWVLLGRNTRQIHCQIPVRKVQILSNFFCYFLSFQYSLFMFCYVSLFVKIIDEFHFITPEQCKNKYNLMKKYQYYLNKSVCMYAQYMNTSKFGAKNWCQKVSLTENWKNNF